jgi:hypothetical protein
MSMNRLNETEPATFSIFSFWAFFFRDFVFSKIFPAEAECDLLLPPLSSWESLYFLVYTVVSIFHLDVWIVPKVKA